MKTCVDRKRVRIYFLDSMSLSRSFNNTSSNNYILDRYDALGCLQMGLMIAISYQKDDIEACYHFVKYPLNAPPEVATNILCVGYSATKPDPIGLCSSKTDISTFETMCLQRDYYYCGSHRYSRKGIKVLPNDWYECFETKINHRLSSISPKIEEGKKLGQLIKKSREQSTS